MQLNLRKEAPLPQRVVPPSRQMLYDVPDDVEMEFEAEGVGRAVESVDVILTGEVGYFPAWEYGGIYAPRSRIRFIVWLGASTVCSVECEN